MDAIERDIFIAAVPERVYEIVTRPEHMGVWFGDAGAERDGDTITLRWTDNEAQLRVMSEDPPHAFAYRWKAFDPAAGETLVQFTFTPEGDGTRVKVVESGWDALTGTPEHLMQLREGNVRGWASELADLERYATQIAV